jgi:N-acetylglucosamine malate deacetylase 1
VNTILVIAAHPDDEVLGCGGVMASHAQAGDTVHVAILAEGATSRDDKRDATLRAEELYTLGQAAQAAGQILGVRSVDLLGLPDNRLDSLDLLDLVKVVEALVARLKPSTIYTHHVGDVNIDHQLIHRAVLTACRPMPGQSVKRLLAFEVPSSTEWMPPGSAATFAPTWFEDISTTLSRKLAALEVYASEMRLWPHTRSLRAVEHLARWRGAMVGLEAAEAFQLMRSIEIR